LLLDYSCTSSSWTIWDCTIDGFHGFQSPYMAWASMNGSVLRNCTRNTFSSQPWNAYAKRKPPKIYLSRTLFLKPWRIPTIPVPPVKVQRQRMRMILIPLIVPATVPMRLLLRLPLLLNPKQTLTITLVSWPFHYVERSSEKKAPNMLLSLPRGKFQIRDISP
jgi:hypothetical protein